MTRLFEEIKNLNFPALEKDLLASWEKENTFELSIEKRFNSKNFTFYEGPPTANGRPGIHHVLGRTIKDTFCRYKTLKGFKVSRKAGWDTHGLPVEIEVEKELGLKNREDIENFGIAEFNKHCKKSVLKYKEEWDQLTKLVGYWVDLSDPYVTFDNNYIESVWWLVKRIFEQGLLYKGHKIQWYSPGSGTVLSSHEVSLGYKEVSDPSVYVKFPLVGEEDTSILVWTTTPWTLLSNVAAVVNAEIDYVKVQSESGKLILAEKALDLLPESTKILARFKGKDLVNKKYKALYKIEGQAYNDKCWTIFTADYVTVEEGTGIVHVAPAFGAEDHTVGLANGLPIVNPVMSNGIFNQGANIVAGKWFKDADTIVIADLRKSGLLFKEVDYVHNYPFDWRKGTPLMSYPVEGWFIKTTAVKEKLVELNNSINWKPSSVRQGRFGNWLDNNVDWALSRKRFWGTPLPIWVSDNPASNEISVIGSIEELKMMMGDNFPSTLDLHRPNVDSLTWYGKDGSLMKRVPDVMDVWFDSGAMPFAQWHYPFENTEKFEENFPADFICEGIDQTRGWFYTLHAIATMVKQEKAFKNVVVNGLVLDENGEKMSKSKGNTIDPFKILSSHGADVVRWYVISNSAPWDDMKFSEKGLLDIRAKLFGTLENIYKFFSSYANIDGFQGTEKPVPAGKEIELDRWLLSRLNSTNKDVEEKFDDYDCTGAARAIEKLVDEFSNWYVRRSRERFWAGKKDSGGGNLAADEKLAAYQTTYHCLLRIAVMMSPIAPFFSDWLYRKLKRSTDNDNQLSVHLVDFPLADDSLVDTALEHRMGLARQIVQMVLLLRNREKINVRQPLKKLLLVTNNFVDSQDIKKVERIILNEVNVKKIEYVENNNSLVQRTAKADYKKLGPRLGNKMKEAARLIANLSESKIDNLLSEEPLILKIGDEEIVVKPNEIQIFSESTEDLTMVQEGVVTVALDITVDKALRSEGYAREVINRIQSMRKKADFELTDRIVVQYKADPRIEEAVESNIGVICKETLSSSIIEKKVPQGVLKREFEIGELSIEIGIFLDNTR